MARLWKKGLLVKIFKKGEKLERSDSFSSYQSGVLQDVTIAG